MKNQYFGDVRDWLKYAMLRSVLDEGLSLTVGWMLTSNDGGPDGEVRNFLSNEKNRALDPELFRWIEEWQRRGGLRDIGEIERSGLLGASLFHSELIEDSTFARDAWFARLHQIAAGTDVVFLDPDNGFEVTSCRRGARRSSKYVFWSEVAALVRRGFSVIVYQHLPRVSREVFTAQKIAEARDAGLRDCLVLTTSGVDYFVFPQEHHRVAVSRALEAVAGRSAGRLRFAEHPVSDGSPGRTDGLARGSRTEVTEYVQRFAVDAIGSNERGRSMMIGAENRNQQVVMRRSDAEPSLRGQKVYVLRCGQCAHEYGANGCDVFHRKCPKCQGGAAGNADS